MKKTNLFIKLIAMALVLCVTTVLFAGCNKSDTVVMSFTADNGKTYTITEEEFALLMKIRKRVFFCNMLYTTSKDTAEFWNTKSTEEPEQTNEQYYKDLVMDQVMAVLVEKYLFEREGLAISADKLDSFKAGIKTDEKSAGGKGAYKQYYGYTAKTYYDLYSPMVTRSEMLYEALCKDGAILAASDKDLSDYYTEHYVGYQYIVLDMKNKVERDENGDRIRKTEKDSEGKEVESDSYKKVALSTEEKEEKQTLAKKILDMLNDKENPKTFEEMIAEYSDDYYSVEFSEGRFVDKESTFLNTTVTDKIKDFKVGDMTAEAISYGDYQYIVKKVELKPYAYEEFEKDENGETVKDENGKEVANKYYEFFTDYVDTVEFDKYEKYVEAYFEQIQVNTSITDAYTMKDTFLSSYVDYYYQQILYYYYGIQI